MKELLKLKFYSNKGLINEKKLNIESVTIMSAIDLIECELVFKIKDIRIIKTFKNEQYQELNNLIDDFYKIDLEKLKTIDEYDLDKNNYYLECFTSQEQYIIKELIDTAVINLFNNLTYNYLLEDKDLKSIINVLNA